jgi:hypothetical protein
MDLGGACGVILYVVVVVVVFSFFYAASPLLSAGASTQLTVWIFEM